LSAAASRESINMGPDIASAIIAAIAALISAGAAYFARQQALPEMRKRRLCHSLHALQDAIEDISHTGQEIGQFLGEKSLHEPTTQQLDHLIHLLDIQNDNLSRARQEFKFLSDVLEAKIPELNPLILHLRGKKNRIEIIYTTAKGVQAKLRSKTQPWETSEILDEPKMLRQALAESKDPFEISQGPDPFSDADPDFDKIVEVLPKLRQFITANCEMQYLV
jgi:hypothetical protein